MANNCFTSFCFTGATEVLLEFQTLIENSNDNYLGSVLHAFKIDNDKVPCRGEIIYNSIQDEGLYIDTDTAWAPMPEMWDVIIDKYFTKEGVPEIQYVYLAEEPGCEIYINTDTSRKIFSEKWIIENHYGDKFYFSTDDELLCFINEELIRKGFSKVDNIKDLFDQVAKYNNIDDNMFIIINEFKSL